MGVPRSYLLVPPEGDTFGTAIHWEAFLRRLRKLNKRIQATPVTPWGMSTIWLGTPHRKTSKSISAFTVGEIPEWTVMDDRGLIQAKGWRAILQKAVKLRAFRQTDVEREFIISIDYDRVDQFCRPCIGDGLRRKATSSGGLCTFHYSALKSARIADEGRKEAEACRSTSQKPMTIRFPVTLDS